METKYLSDGRKVAVIGQLNNQESIVQEIFVTDAGDEIPSGERFTTKSLHDSPVKSYKQKEEEKVQARIAGIESDKASAEKELKQIQAKLRGYREIFKQVRTLADHLDEKQLETFAGVMSGSISWAVVENYSGPTLLPFDDAIIYYENSYGTRRFDGVKLVSMLGRSDGQLDFRLSQYSDGSGSHDNVRFFDSKDDASDYMNGVAKAIVAEGKMDLDKMERFTEAGVVFTKKETKETVSKALKTHKDNIAYHQGNADKNKQRAQGEIDRITKKYA